LKHFRQFIVAKTPDEAVDLRRSVGVKSLYIAGGTTVVPYAATGVEVLIDITKLGLDSIRFEDDTISIGATTRLSGLDSPDIKATFPMLHEAVRRCATPLIRNMATLGGALGGIHLPSDVGVALLALGAEISLTGETDRVVSMEDLLTDGWLKRHELIKGISIKMPRKDAAGSFQKSGRSEIDIALVNVATTLAITGAGTIDSLRIAVGQTSSMPTLLAGVTD
jgi:CO/xanthine dehydrogenase FAD-binding subunit